jgi:hypothetical protein
MGAFSEIMAENYVAKPVAGDEIHFSKMSFFPGISRTIHNI